MELIVDALFKTAQDLAAGILFACVLILAFCLPLIIRANRKQPARQYKPFDYAAALRPIGSAPLNRHFTAESMELLGKERVGLTEQWRREMRRAS